MTSIEIVDVKKRYRTDVGDVEALAGVSLSIGDGEVVALVGPSGCGKTTLLRAVAGLEHPDEGSIAIGGHRVFEGGSRLNVEPERRSVGMVFQSYALWPHMSVEQNVEYPLRCRRWQRAKRRQAVRRVLELVGCGEFAARYPAQLSGGQQQRIALARAIVAEPDVVLFDEPLSNLDARLRDELRFEIRALHQRTGLTSLYVTHDRTEAWVVADRLVVMNNGRILQEGTADEILHRPRTAFVARFMADNNYVVGVVVVAGAAKALSWQGSEYVGVESGDPVGVGGRAALCVDPHDVTFVSPEIPVGREVNTWPASVMGTVRTPVATESYIQLDGGMPWKVISAPGDPLPAIGERVLVAARSTDCRLLATTVGSIPDHPNAAVSGLEDALDAARPPHLALQ